MRKIIKVERASTFSSRRKMVPKFVDMRHINSQPTFDENRLSLIKPSNHKKVKLNPDFKEPLRNLTNIDFPNCPI
jgi:protein tyrosine phosphatase